MEKLKKLIKLIDVNLEPIVILTLFTLLTTLLSIQVVLRFLFNTGLAWGDEVARFMFVWMVFFSIACAFRNNRHISVNFVRDLLPIPARKIIAIISDLSMIFLMAILFYGAFSNVLKTIEYGDMATTISISMNWLYSSALVGLSICLIRLIQSLVWKIKRINASYELFLNLRGNYSGVEYTFFIPAHYKKEMVALRSEEVLREEQEKLYKKSNRNSNSSKGGDIS